jgi:hypothetical protein
LSVLDALRRAKLEPLTLLLLLAGLVVVAYVALGVSALRERRDQDALSSQIDLGEGVLVVAEDSQQELEDLEARLRAAEQELALAQSAFPSEVDSDDVLRTILAHANESRARVLRVETQPPTTGADEENAYSVLGFNLEVEGDFGQLVAFLAALESGAIGASKTGAFSLEGEEGRYTLNLEVLTYARSAVDVASAPETAESPSGPAMEPAGVGEDIPSE